MIFAFLFLGYVVSKDRLSVDESKATVYFLVKMVNQWPTLVRS